MTSRTRQGFPIAATTLAIGLCIPSLTSCQLSRGLGRAACPAMRADVDALSANFGGDARASAKISAFVQAAKDMQRASLQLERQVSLACRRIGADLGLAPSQMAARKGSGGAATGACAAVSAQIDVALRRGLRLRLAVTPPSCQVNAQAYGRCSGRCDVQQDAQCRSSCQAHADANAQCSAAQVQLQVVHGGAQAVRLVTALRTHLPALVHAQLALGERLSADARIIAQVGSNLPRLVGQAGAQALACVGAAADVAASASVRIQVSVRASASISARANSG